MYHFSHTILNNVSTTKLKQQLNNWTQQPKLNIFIFYTLNEWLNNLICNCGVKDGNQYTD